MKLCSRVVTRWFAFADLFFVVSSLLLLELAPGLGGLALLLAALPWLIRVFAGQFPFQRTHFDWLVIIFILTAGVGIWAAYNPVEAWQKFWLLGGGVFLFYALAGQPGDNQWWIAGFAILVGVGAALFFILINDWQVHPAKIGLINQAGLWWMKVRPAFLAGLLHSPNIADDVAGVIAFTTPFLLAHGTKAWNEKNIPAAVCCFFCGSIFGAGFLLSISRAAAIALGIGLATWAVWVVIDRFKPFFNTPRRVRLSIFIGLAGFLLLGSFFMLRGGLPALLRALLNFYAASERQDVAVGAIKLIGDFPFTGGGLGSFPGLYSYYILDVSNFFITNSHNLFLDVGLEQGTFGMLAFSLIYLGCAGRLLSAAPKTKKVLLQAAFASLVIIILQGLVDDIVYDLNSASLVFLVPGIAYAVSQPALLAKQSFRFRHPQVFSYSVLAVIVLFAALLAMNWNALLASWYTNLGAVQLAKIELVIFPDPPQEGG
ncbi:MAG: O-antigen ligase family protein, partial [Anaerolineaceae bacterium]|nr:O-antigen ligase family protein [Anaerolineaceae bacterium]